MKTVGILFVAAVPVVVATKGFTYNDDIICGYPFEDFVIESITCAPSSYISVWPDEGQPANIYDSLDVCAFGNEMEITGKVVVSQAVARKYNANLQACFRTSQASWYSAKKCMLFKTTVDLRSYSVPEGEEQAEGQAEGEGEGQAAATTKTTTTYYDYVDPGEFFFSARVIIPKKTFVFNADYIVAAELSLVPSSYSTVADSYKFTSVCNASFNAIYDASESRYSNKYAAATILALGLLCSAYIAGGKTRRLCTGKSEDVAELPVDNDFIEMNKIDEDAEDMAIESAQATSPISNTDVSKDKKQSKKLFPDFFRRQSKQKSLTKRDDSFLTTTDSSVEQHNDFVAI